MGFRVSAALARTSPEDLIAGLDLATTGTKGEMPEQGIWCASLGDTGWAVVYANDFSFIERAQDHLERLSATVPAYAMRVHETVMVSQGTRYDGGRILWSVDWVGEHGPDPVHLQSTGDIPAGFEDARKAAAEQQAGVTDVDYYFDVPLTLLEAETGFRHDRWFEPDMVDKFRIVAEAAPSNTRNGLLSRFFGGRQ